MTEEESRLAALLQQAVPQPPRSVSPEDIAARVADRAAAAPRKFGPWVPALAAACALLVIAATSVWLIGSGFRPAAPTPQSSRASTAPLPPVTGTSPGPAVTSAGTLPRNSGDPVVPRQSDITAEPTTAPSPGPFVGPWSARLLNSVPIDFVIVGGADAAYGLEGRQLDRFDPADGYIAAHRLLDPNTNWPPVVTTQALWLTVMTQGGIIVQKLDPHSLQRSWALQLATTPATTDPPWTPALAATKDGSELFLGYADQLYSVNPVDGMVEQHRLDGHVGGLAVSPDGSRLYVGVNVRGSETARLLALDIRHGLSTISETPLASGLVTDLLATSGALWATLDDTVYFAPLTDPTHDQVVIGGGGGLPATATLAGGVVWLSGLGSIACADARTGAVRAQANSSGWGNMAQYVGSVQLVAGHWLGSYGTNYSNDRGLAALAPPARCR